MNEQEKIKLIQNKLSRFYETDDIDIYDIQAEVFDLLKEFEESLLAEARKQEREKILNSIKNIVWMARRYADGRRTYAPSMFNDAYDHLRDVLGEVDLNNDKDTCKSFPYAQDGQIDVVKGRKYLDDQPENI